MASYKSKPINPKEVRARAFETLHAARNGQHLPSIVDLVKPIRIDKNDPTVRKLLSSIK